MTRLRHYAQTVTCGFIIPTWANFGDIDPAAYQTALERAEDDVSLYVHIPSYEKICFYCGCQTGAVGRRSRLDSYHSALHSELETVSATLPSGTRIGREAFGGGKPQCERAGGFHPAG